MFEVIKKDLILNRMVITVYHVFIAAGLVFFATVPDDFPPVLFAIFCGLMASSLPLVMVIREEKFNAMALGCSLPVTRRTIVRARYVLCFGMAVLGLSGAVLVAPALPGTQYGFTDLLAPGPLMAGLAFIALFLSFLLPFTLRFGLPGVMTFLVATQVLGVLLLTIVKLTDPSVDNRIVARVVAAIVACHRLLGGWGFMLCASALLAGIVLLSYLLSARIFARREL